MQRTAFQTLVLAPCKLSVNRLQIVNNTLWAYYYFASNLMVKAYVLCCQIRCLDILSNLC